MPSKVMLAVAKEASVLCYMGLSPGLLMTWQLAFPRADDLTERQRQRPREKLLCLLIANLRSAITSPVFRWSHRPPLGTI